MSKVSLLCFTPSVRKLIDCPRITKLFVQNLVTISVSILLTSLRWWQRYLEILVISIKVSVCQIKFDGSQVLRVIGTTKLKATVRFYIPVSYH